jgi:ribosomal RNA-processing protein 12
MLCFKDTNVKTRSAAQELLSLMAEKCGTMDVLKVVAAGLGAQTSHMQSAAVLALSRLVYEFSSHSIEVQASLPSLLTTVLVLIDSNAREVVKSVVGFIRVSVTTISPEQLELVIPEVVGCLTRYHKPKNRFRSKIKIILKKLVKLFGYETLMPHIPESESRLLIHIKKANQRQEQKKAASRTPRSCNATAFDAMMGSDEEDSDEGRTLVSGTTRRTTAMQSTGKSKLTRSDRGTVTSGLGSARNAPTLRLPNDTSGEVVDMMSTKHTRLVQFAEDRAMDDSSDRDDMLEFDDDGRLIIKDDEPTHIDGVVDDMPPRHKQRTLKGTLSDERSRTGSIKSTKLGSNYKAKKAGGDVKRKDQKLEPYAFIPLDGRQYSRKNRRAAVNDMSHVVRGRKRVKR